MFYDDYFLRSSEDGITFYSFVALNLLCAANFLHGASLLYAF
jgi:hypothetical protein